MAIHYQHRQRGTLMLVALIVGALALAATAYLDPTPSRWLCLALACGLLILSWLFSSLIVVVGDGELSWYFGPGLWQYRMTLGEIRAVRVVRNSWTDGFGIRMRPGFRLYNGEIRRIGTDDAPALAAVLKHE
jgi:hypothetical protein